MRDGKPVEGVMMSFPVDRGNDIVGPNITFAKISQKLWGRESLGDFRTKVAGNGMIA